MLMDPCCVFLVIAYAGISVAALVCIGADLGLVSGGQKYQAPSAWAVSAFGLGTFWVHYGCMLSRV